MNKKQIYKSNFFFSTLRHFEKLIFKAIKTRSKAEQLSYLIFLKSKCQKEIDNVLMKNNKEEIFKYLDSIDNNGE